MGTSMRMIERHWPRSSTAHTPASPTGSTRSTLPFRSESICDVIAFLFVLGEGSRGSRHQVMEGAEPWSDVRVVCVVSWRRNGAVQREFLILHPRYAGGVDFEGSGHGRLPLELSRKVKRRTERERELREETGLSLACTPLEDSPAR